MTKPTQAQIEEAEPPDLNDILFGFTNYVSNERVRAYNEGVDTTIERCAQRLEELASVSSDKEVLLLAAAAIRKLKDAP